MQTMKRLSCILVVIVLTSVAGQAPGDESERCTVTLPGLGLNVFVDPPNVVPLMDTSHYEFLLPPNPNPVWQRLDLDDSSGGTQWTPLGSVCVTEVVACYLAAGPQNNWLITQHINTTLGTGERLSQVTTEVEYIQNMCDEAPCQRVFDVLKYETSTIDPVSARNTSNYDLVTGLTTRRALEKVTETETIDLSTNETGFYLAIVDRGTCITITRLVVFYYICPAETVNLVVRPRTVAPPDGANPLQVPVGCVENARPAGGDSLILTCLSEGRWLDPTSGCVCAVGFVLSPDGQQCIKCEPGFYASESLGRCVVCPNNSNSTESGLEECPCDEGYYRTPQELDLPCTQPPSPPLNVMVVSSTSTTVTLSWDEPLSTGGRNRGELRYNLWYRAEGLSDQFILSGTVINTTMGEIRGLILDSGVVYQLLVSAETDITAQIPVSNLSSRSTAILYHAQDTTSTAMSTTCAALIAGVTASVLAAVVTSSLSILIAVGTAVLCYRRKVKEIESRGGQQLETAVELQQKNVSTDPHHLQLNPSYGQVMNTGSNRSENQEYEVVN